MTWMLALKIYGILFVIVLILVLGWCRVAKDADRQLDDEEKIM